MKVLRFICFSYLAALGRTRTAQIQCDARIGEAKSKRDAGIKQAIANQEKQKVRFENDTEIAQAKRDFEIKKAAYDIEVELLIVVVSSQLIVYNTVASRLIIVSNDSAVEHYLG